MSLSLTQAQINFIVARIASGGFDVSDVSLGMGLAADGNGGPILTEFEIKPVPEPGTLTLLAAGLAMAGVRRLRKSSRH